MGKLKRIDRPMFVWIVSGEIGSRNDRHGVQHHIVAADAVDALATAIEMVAGLRVSSLTKGAQISAIGAIGG